MGVFVTYRTLIKQDPRVYTNSYVGAFMTYRTPNKQLNWGPRVYSNAYVGMLMFSRTLIKQGPYGRRPVVRKAIVITPGSLVKVQTLFYNH